MKKIILILALLSVFFVTACTSSQSGSTNNAILRENQPGTSQNNLVELASNYFRYDKAHFEKSRAEGKVIFLDYHANWCPICARENPKILAAFNQLDNENIVGYQVHFNDGETNKDDIQSAKDNGITNQYTKVIIDKNGITVLKTLEILDTNRIINELNKAVGE